MNYILTLVYVVCCCEFFRKCAGEGQIFEPLVLEFSDTTTTNNHQQNMRRLPQRQSIFKIETCDSMTWIPVERREALKTIGQAHYCVDVFHALITAPDDSDLDNCDGKNMMLLAANIMAEFLDTSPSPHAGGITSDEVRRRFVWDRPVPDGVDSSDVDALRIPFMHVRCAGHLESGQPLGMYGIGTNFVKLTDDNYEYHLRSVAVHETFHMFHAEVYSYVYPELEDKEWTGALALCAKEANCRWYTHGGNVGCYDYEGNSCPNGDWSPECIDVMNDYPETPIPGLCFQRCGCSGPTCNNREMLAEVWNKYHEFTQDDFTSPTGHAIGMINKTRLVEEMSKTENCRLLLNFMEVGNTILPLDITGDYLINDDLCKVNSHLKFRIGKGKFRKCKWASKKKRCNLKGVKDTCALTCGSDGPCVDSSLKFEINGVKGPKTCSRVKTRKRLCKKRGVKRTCPVACKESGNGQ